MLKQNHPPLQEIMSSLQQLSGVYMAYIFDINSRGKTSQIE